MDFVVTLNRKLHWLIEVKSSDDTLSPSLKYYAEKLRPQQSLQLVLHLDRAQEKSGIKIVRLDRWLESLDFDRPAHAPCRGG